MIFDEINNKLDEILSIHKSLPTWMPISGYYAKECGYKTINGLRKWCMNNLSPKEFEKIGNSWCIHSSALHKVKRKIV